MPESTDTAAAHTAGQSLPGGWALDPLTRDSAESAAVEITLGVPNITTTANSVHLRLPPEAAASQLAYVTYTALERERQRQRKATVHASAVITPTGSAVLLLGAKGAGKTSTALALGEYGWTHAGDDLVVLGETEQGLTVWPGKPTAAVRDTTRPLAPKTGVVLTPFATQPAPVSWVVRLAVHPALTRTSLTPAVPLSLNEKLRLHEMLARYISGLPTPLSGVSGVPYGPVWPLDNGALARWRRHLISQLTHGACRFDYLYAPSPEYAARMIKEAT